jgi:hypothetical protein
MQRARVWGSWVGTNCLPPPFPPPPFVRITTKMDKLFCPTCGNPSLAKLGVTLRKNGQPDFHYAKGRRVNIRGSKFPLPNPKVGCGLRVQGGVWTCACRGVNVYVWGGGGEGGVHLCGGLCAVCFRA